MEWILNPPGAAGGYLAMLLLVLAIIYMGYAFYKYR
jgi:hypothetical protein